MRALLVVSFALAFGCNKTPPPPELEPVEQLENEAVLAKSHAFFDAIDHDDAEAAKPMLGMAFTKVESGRFTNAQLLLQDLRANYGHPPATRKWTEEKAFSAPGSATFVGAATESFSHPDGGPAGDFNFRNTLVWTKNNAGWSLALWQVERIRSPKDQWNEAYRLGIGFRHEPNQLLVAAAQSREPGRALDIGMGQGRNALYLASQGWKVTGIDISDEGINQARAEAQKRSLEIEAIEVDRANYDYGIDKWDLVSLLYAGADPKEIERIKKATKVNGLVVIEVLEKEAADLASSFQGWGLLRDEVTDDFADWGGPNKTKLVRLVALKRRDRDAEAEEAGAPIPDDAGAASNTPPADAAPTPGPSAVDASSAVPAATSVPMIDAGQGPEAPPAPTPTPKPTLPADAGPL